MPLKFLIKIALCFLSLNIFSHEGKHYQLKECRPEADPLKPFPVKQVPPVYPREALYGSVEGAVLLEFTVTEEGKVAKPIVKWFDQTSGKKSFFSRSAIQAAKKWKFNPAKTETGESISAEGERAIIIYRLEGYEDNLGIKSSSLTNIIRKTKVKDMSSKSMKRLEDALNEINSRLKSDDLSSIEKAAFLYIKATTLFKLDRPSADIKQVLLESKSYYKDEFVDTLRGGVQIRGVTSSKLQTFVGLLLSQIYYEEEDWKSLEHEMLEVINSTQLNMMSKRYYSSYMQLGVASYTLKNWCTSAASFEKARSIAKAHTLKFPDSFDTAIIYARSQLK